MACSCLLAAALGPSFAQAAPGLSGSPSVMLTTFARIDDLRWRIAGNGGSPEIGTELLWENLDSIGVGARATGVMGGAIYLRADGRVSWVYDGSYIERHFNGSGRSQEYQRIDSLADDGTLWDLSGGVGYVLVDSDLSVVPLLGFSIHRQLLDTEDGTRTVCAPPCTSGTGAVTGRDDRYESSWFGPWAGVDLSYTAGAATFFALIEYHMFEFRADGDWSLRPDLEHPKSFEQEADGDGFVMVFGLDGRYTERLHLGGEIEMRNFIAEDGTHTYLNASAADEEVGLGKVNWEYLSVGFSVKYDF